MQKYLHTYVAGPSVPIVMISQCYAHSRQVMASCSIGTAQASSIREILKRYAGLVLKLQLPHMKQIYLCITNNSSELSKAVASARYGLKLQTPLEYSIVV